MKKTISGMALVFMLCSPGGVILAQDAAKAKPEQYSPVKPADGHPYVFNSQEELNAKRELKKNNIVSQIKQYEGNPGKVKHLREDLWRLENAIVKNPNTEK